MASEDDGDEHEARTRRGPDQGSAADGHPGQAGDPDAGHRFDRRDLLPARRSRPGESHCGRTDPGLHRRSGLERGSPAPPSGGCRLLTVLTWTPARTLPRDDGAAVEDLPAPNAPRLTAIQR